MSTSHRIQPGTGQRLLVVTLVILVLGGTIGFGIHGYRVWSRAYERRQQMTAAQKGDRRAIGAILTSGERGRIKRILPAIVAHKLGDQLHNEELNALKPFGKAAAPVFLEKLDDDRTDRIQLHYDTVAWEVLEELDPSLDLVWSAVEKNPSRYRGLLLQKWESFARGQGIQPVLDVLADRLEDDTLLNRSYSWEDPETGKQVRRKERVGDAVLTKMIELLGDRSPIKRRQVFHATADQLSADRATMRKWYEEHGSTLSFENLGWVRVRFQGLAALTRENRGFQFVLLRNGKIVDDRALSFGKAEEGVLLSGPHEQGAVRLKVWPHYVARQRVTEESAPLERTIEIPANEKTNEQRVDFRVFVK